MRPKPLLVSVLLLAGVLAGPAVDGVRAARPKVRTASEPYTGAQAVLVGASGTPNAYVGDCDPASESGCVRFEIRRKERYMTLEVRDQSGLPVYAVAFAPDGTEVGDLCGRTEEPLAAPGGYVDVWLTYGSCYESPWPSVPTTGTVEASFSAAASAL